ncbi:MAG: hypothetical protein ACPGPS_09695 [Rubripirellula sp.]
MPNENAGGIGYVGRSKATDASMIIGEALFCMVTDHQNAACGLEGGCVVAEFGARLNT